MKSGRTPRSSTGSVRFLLLPSFVPKCLYLDGGVEFVLIARFDSFQPLDDRLDVTADFALERRGASIVHSGVDGVTPGQDGFSVGTLCTETQKTEKT